MTLSTLGVGQPTLGGGSAFSYDAVNFDGTNDWLTRGADFSGTSDSATGILYWFAKWTTSTSILSQLFTSNSGHINAGVHDGTINPNGSVNINLQNAAATATLNVRTSGGLNNGAWHSFLASWDVNAAAGSRTFHLYVDDVSDKTILTDTGIAFNVDYTDTDWAVGALVSGSFKLISDLAEFYFAPGQFLDFSNVTNRRKFIDASNKPVDLGANGSTPTGAQPLVYLHVDAAEAANNFAANAGSGAGMTVNGALSLASTKP